MAEDRKLEGPLWELRRQEYDNAGRISERVLGASERLSLILAAANATGIGLMVAAVLDGRLAVFGDDLQVQYTNAVVGASVATLAAGALSAITAWALVMSAAHKYASETAAHIFDEAVEGRLKPYVRKSHKWTNRAVGLLVLLSLLAPIFVVWETLGHRQDAFVAKSIEQPSSNPDMTK